ncbi:MAG TPA: YihY/virulence factor BrkB family protein [Pseudonocardiaceae bacterium]
MGATARLDDLQQRHTWLGFPVAVIYKYVDDQGGYLAALLTYYGFIALFPLLLLLVSVLGFVLQDNQDLQQALLGSAFEQIPILGPQLQQSISSIQGSTTGVVIGILGAVYGVLGASVAIQAALNRVWAVPYFARPDPVVSRLRGLVLFVLLGAVLLTTTALSVVASMATGYGPRIDTGVRIAAFVVAMAANAGAFLIGFRVLTARDIALADLIPGAVCAAVGVQVLQTAGTFLVGRTLTRMSAIYGVFAVVLGLLAWLYLQSVVVVFSAEINAVRARRLWPRSLLAGIVADAALTPADEAAYRSYIRTARFTPLTQVHTTFDQPPPKNDES